LSWQCLEFLICPAANLLYDRFSLILYNLPVWNLGHWPHYHSHNLARSYGNIENNNHYYLLFLLFQVYLEQIYCCIQLNQLYCFLWWVLIWNNEENNLEQFLRNLRLLYLRVWSLQFILLKLKLPTMQTLL